MTAVAPLASLIDAIDGIQDHRVYGRVTAILGLMVEVDGIVRKLTIGSRCVVEARSKRRVEAEVVGFRNGRALLMPFGPLEGVGLGCRAEVTTA